MRYACTLHTHTVPYAYNHRIELKCKRMTVYNPKESQFVFSWAKENERSMKIIGYNQIWIRFLRIRTEMFTPEGGVIFLRSSGSHCRRSSSTILLAALIQCICLFHAVNWIPIDRHYSFISARAVWFGKTTAYDRPLSRTGKLFAPSDMRVHWQKTDCIHCMHSAEKKKIHNESMILPQ